MKRIVVVVTVVVLAAALAAVLVPPRADAQSTVNPSVEVTGGLADSCTNTGTAIDIPVFYNFTDATPRSFSYVMTAPANSTIVAQQNVDFTGPLTGASVLTITPTAYNLPANSEINLTVTTFNGAGGTGGQSFLSSFTFDCTTGAEVTGGPAPAPGVGGGSSSIQAEAGAPGEFALTGIVCDVPVFGLPGANPIPGTLVLVGQTWFVNPILVAGPADEAGAISPSELQPDETWMPWMNFLGHAGPWAEIYVGSANRGYIPAACVSGEGFTFDDQPFTRVGTGFQGTPFTPLNQGGIQSTTQQQNQTKPDNSPTPEATSTPSGNSSNQSGSQSNLSYRG